jgi:hypothetical protein
MRLFNHYITTAHPPLFESIWIRDVPAISYQYEYLMHAVLASAGTHANLVYENAEYGVALYHRQNAIRGLNAAMARWPMTAHEAHAMLATSFLLSFQSNLMPDGFIDHVMSVRGSHLLVDIIRSHQLEGVFPVDDSLHDITLQLRLENFPVLDQDLLRNALLSLDGIAPLLDTLDARDIQRDMYRTLIESVRPITPVPQPQSVVDDSNNENDIAYHVNTATVKIADAARAFDALASSIYILETRPQEEALCLLDSNNTLSQIIMSHWAALRFILAPLSAPERALLNTPVKAMVGWCGKIVNHVQDDHRDQWTKYIRWPAMIISCMRQCVEQDPKLTLAGLFDILVKDPKAFVEGRLARF